MTMELSLPLWNSTASSVHTTKVTAVMTFTAADLQTLNIAAAIQAGTYISELNHRV